MQPLGVIDIKNQYLTTITHFTYLNDSIFESLLPGGLQQGNLSRKSSNDLFISFIRARSRSQADLLYCSAIEIKKKSGSDKIRQD